MTSIGTAKAKPTKAFFVRMLTRDISLDDCILDLVDNSIDSAWETAGRPADMLTPSTHLAAFRIDITFDGEAFSISDNCGGISFEDAVDYAFTFGKSTQDSHDDYSVGVYGIGMKRAIFKLGNQIHIRSTSTDSEPSSFQVPINVNQWLQDDAPEAWDFVIDDSEALAEPGVDILVSELSRETGDRFQDPLYERRLRQVLGRDYLLPLMHGLTITVNTKDVTATPLALRSGGEFSPLRERYEDGDVGVQLLAGMGAQPPDSAEPDDAQPEIGSGWYVFCNGRAVLAADTTHVTGWGTELPLWHPQYRGFIGMIFFNAANPADLPMTTTKRSVDLSSGVYRRALARMAKPTRAWIDYTNIRKTDLDEAKRREGAATPIGLNDVPERESVILPQLPKAPAKAKVANVNYAKPLKEMKALAAAFGNINHTNRDVGIMSFEYAYEHLVDEDDEQ